MSPQEASAAGGAGVFSADRGGFVSRRSRRLGRFFGIWSRLTPSFLKRLDFLVWRQGRVPSAHGE